MEGDPDAEKNYVEPRQQALEAYDTTLDRMKLDGYVYPATQMPPPDETMPQEGQISGGPHSDYELGEYPGSPSSGGAGRLLLEWSAVWAGDLGQTVEGRRPARVRVRLRADNKGS